MSGPAAALARPPVFGAEAARGRRRTAPDRQPWLPHRHLSAAGVVMKGHSSAPGPWHRACVPGRRARRVPGRSSEDPPMLAHPFLLSTLLGPPSASRRAARVPALAVHARPEGALVRALVPGLAPQDIEITVAGKHLTLAGERGGDADAAGSRAWIRERAEGRFARTLELPFGIDVQGVRARCERGVLEIELPRAKDELPIKIAVNPG